LATALVLAGACWFADSRLREMDQRIASLAADVAAAQQQIERGDRTDKTHEAIATRWKNRQEWIPALDAVFRPMEEEDAVELAMLNADGSRGVGESEFVISGTAPDSTVVPRLLARYAQDKSIVEVSPLGIRPQRNQDGEGVQFDLRVVRKAGPGSRE
jgi:DNA invertase Pin-like site-specific DNA recombinase